jgi:hypothetical protein
MKSGRSLSGRKSGLDEAGFIGRKVSSPGGMLARGFLGEGKLSAFFASSPAQRSARATSGVLCALGGLLVRIFPVQIAGSYAHCLYLICVRRGVMAITWFPKVITHRLMVITNPASVIR